MENAVIRRFNIYSCLTLKICKNEFVFDPAKIVHSHLDSICPDYIFISHESMDHMDPCQVYILQKKKNCPVFCNLAAAIDLLQFFSYDREFFSNIHAVMPDSILEFGNLIIQAKKSVHCDYMFPLIFKITLKKEEVSLLHCFDTLFSKEMVEFSSDTSLAIVPIGIAKGICLKSGLEFLENLKSKAFLPNHFKLSSDLQRFKELVPKKLKCYFADWDEEVQIGLEKIEIKQGEIKIEDVDKNRVLNFAISNVTAIRSNFLRNKEFLSSIFNSYCDADQDKKILLLALYTLVAILDSNLIEKTIVGLIESDLEDVSNENNSLGTIILLFLSVLSQQSSKVYGVSKAISLVSKNKEHLTYWVIEFLGRCIISNKLESRKLMSKFLEVISAESVYNSLVIRRKIFWEFYRVIKFSPSLANKFLDLLEGGLVDENPDVKLLCVLCFQAASCVVSPTKSQIDKIFDLFKDEEDDVREVSVKAIKDIASTKCLCKNRDNIFSLLQDSNFHVKKEAKITKKFIESREFVFEKLNATMV